MKAFAGTMGASLKQSAGDALHKAVFGTQKHHLGNDRDNTEGFWKVGQQVMKKGHQRTATAEDVREHNSKWAASLGLSGSAVDDALQRGGNELGSTFGKAEKSQIERPENGK